MKIMKYTLWATVGLSLLFASCESILDINPKDRLTTKDYFTNEEQLQLYSNQFYSNNFPGDGDIYRDDADVLIVSPLDDEVSGQRVIPETGGGWSWSALRSINFYWIIWETVKIRKCAINMKPWHASSVLISILKR